MGGGGPDGGDEALLHRFQAGDPAALEALFERHMGLLTMRARQVVPGALRRRVSISDVIQEARIAAWRRAPEFEVQAEERAGRNWLLKIVELKAREAVRAHARTAKRNALRDVSRGGRPDTREFAGAGPSPSEGASAVEGREAVERALGKLSQDHARVLRLARLDRLTLGQIAERMGRSRESIKKLYGRALVRFTQALGAEGAPDG